MAAKRGTKTGATSITTAAAVRARICTPNGLMVNGQPNPNGTGRYCAPLRCYCGGCDGYEEQRAAAEQVRLREYEKIRNKDPRRKQ